MKLTKSQLKQIIKEELENVLKEEDPDYAIHKGHGPDVPYSGPDPAEKIIAKYAAQSKNHGEVITRVLKTYLATGKIDPEAHQLDDYGKQLIDIAFEDPKLRRGL